MLSGTLLRGAVPIRVMVVRGHKDHHDDTTTLHLPLHPDGRSPEELAQAEQHFARQIQQEPSMDLQELDECIYQ
jgi:hypothetical protein